MSTSGGIVLGGLSEATVHLNAAAILTLFSAPTTIVAAPGANKAIVIVNSFGEFKAGLTAYGAVSLAAYYAAPLLANQATVGLDALLDGNQTSKITSAIPMPQQASLAADGAILSQGFTRTLAANAALVIGSITSDPQHQSGIVTSAPVSGGTGYVIGDTGTVDGKLFGTAAAYVVDTVAAITGAVLTYHLASVGTGYDLISNPHSTTAAGAQPGIGTGFTLNVTAINPADGDMYVTILYQTLTLH